MSDLSVHVTKSKHVMLIFQVLKKYMSFLILFSAEAPEPAALTATEQLC